MTDVTLPEPLEAVFAAHTDPYALLVGILPAVCEVLQSDRCFLHLRNPHTRIYRNLCWRNVPDIPDTSTSGWEPEEQWEKDDPMFAAALRLAPSIFVEDVETAGPEVLNVEFERQNFGHRALIHAHVGQDGLMWAVLQPCLFGRPRQWSETDRAVINALTQRLLPVAIAAVEAAGV
ncbi:MAG TPA: GAF domain-containing protein [Chroococcidiopsis sp.]